MKKLILFFPYTVYQFLKKYSRTDEYNAYSNGLMFSVMFAMMYFLFLFPQVFSFVIGKIHEYTLIYCESLSDPKLIEYIVFFFLVMSMFIFIKKNTLDNLKYNKLEIRIAYILSAIIIWLPPLLFIIVIVKIIFYE